MESVISLSLFVYSRTKLQICLQQRVADFIRQEAQHGIAHDKMNQVMKEQGMPVDQFIKTLNKMLNLN